MLAQGLTPSRIPDMAWIGTPRWRVEDRPLLLGAARCTDDISPPGTLQAQLLRSPHAHARLTWLAVAAARRALGVVAVVAGADERHLGAPGVNRFFREMKIAPHPVLADGVVRAVGDPWPRWRPRRRPRRATRWSGSRWKYEPLPALVSAAAALVPGAPVLHPALGDNRAFTGSWREGDASGAFRRAHRVVRLAVSQTRLGAVTLEPRGLLAAWDQARSELTVRLSTQPPFRARSELARILGIPESRVRVIAPEVGGGFGVEGVMSREDVLVAWLSRELGRPVKWVATRMEDLATTQHGRRADAEGELAVEADGNILGLRARILAPLASVMTVTAGAQARNYGRTLPGPYRGPAADIEVIGAYTTTAPTGPYRGAGRPEGIFLIERLMDEAARALERDPAEGRRRNFIPAGVFPQPAASTTLATIRPPSRSCWRAPTARRCGRSSAGCGRAAS
jgi:carbon-monoxide dehydrogenase large subunit